MIEDNGPIGRIAGLLVTAVICGIILFAFVPLMINTSFNMGGLGVIIALIPVIFLIGIVIYFIHKVNNRDEFINGGWRK